MSNEPWYVELPDGERQIVEAGGLRVNSGHLLAYQTPYEATPERPLAAWAPGGWIRFWRRPAPDQIENLKLKIAFSERWAAEEPENVNVGMLNCQIQEWRDDLAYLEKAAAEQVPV